MPYGTSKQWLLWRLAGDGTTGWTEDTIIGGAGANDYRAANYSSAGSILAADGYPAVALRMFGTGDSSANDRTEIVISGWMHNTSVAGQRVGPGQRLWSGVFYGGSRTLTPDTSESVLLETRLDSVTWREAFKLIADKDTLPSDMEPTADPGTAFIHGGHRFKNQQALILPTLGYTRLALQVSHVGSATTRNPYVAILARKLTAAQLLSLRPPLGGAINPEGLTPTVSDDITAGATQTFSWHTARRAVLIAASGTAGATASLVASTFYIKWNAGLASATVWDNTLTSTATLPDHIWSPPGVRILSLTMDADDSTVEGRDFTITGWV